jgi:hypothetical protein
VYVTTKKGEPVSEDVLDHNSETHRALLLDIVIDVCHRVGHTHGIAMLTLTHEYRLDDETGADFDRQIKDAWDRQGYHGYRYDARPQLDELFYQIIKTKHYQPSMSPVDLSQWKFEKLT